MQIELRKILLGLYLKYCIRILFYSGVGLDRFHCVLGLAQNVTIGK
jgi:hypothetical protein